MYAKVKLATGVSVELDKIPSEVSKLTFVSAFLNESQMKRLFTGSQSGNICKELGIEPTKSESNNCKAIVEYFKG